MNGRAAAAAGLLAFGMVAGPGSAAWASGQAPPGNNGHIQIDEYAMDGGSGNDPHVGCGFSVSFFGYDAGTQHATISITPWAPTGGGHPTTYGPVSWTVSGRTGGNQLDYNYPVSAADVGAIFSGVSPAHQGYHARVEVEVTGSRGSDDKYKMLWIAPCAGPAATPPVGATGPSSASAPGSAGTAGSPGSAGSPPAAVSHVSAASVAPATAAGAAPGAPTEVLGESISRPVPSGLQSAPGGPARATPTSVGGLLAFTGANIAGLAGLALALGATGLVLVRRSRRLHAS